MGNMAMSRRCIPYTPNRRPLSETTVALVTTAGVHLRSQDPFNPEGEKDFRVIPGDVDTAELMISHPYYDHADADRDVNCVFPIDRLRELSREGRIGGLTESHFSLGFSQALRDMREKTVPALVREIDRTRPDIVLLTGG
jgi:hypothetical protein